MISVCIATYNGEKYIREQIDSILVQLGGTDEIIVSDDGSTDSTIDILSSYQDRRIKIFLNENHICKRFKYSSSHYSVTRNFENALKEASGDYVFLADQDDIWNPDKVKLTLPFLKENYLVMSNYSLINNLGECYKEQYLANNPISKYLLRNIATMPFHGCCLAFRRELLDYALPFPDNLIMHDNWIGCICLVWRKKWTFINQPLVMYRRHQMNVSSAKNKSSNPLTNKILYRIRFLWQLWNHRIYNLRVGIPK